MVTNISKLNHPSILKFYEYSQNNFKNDPKTTIITEFCKFSLSSSQSSNRILFIIYGVASAMSYLHSHGILHRNLTFENIYYDENSYPKLFGFDYSIDVSSNLANKRPLRFSNVKGEFKYQAPEVQSKFEYSKSSDVYSFSLLMYEILMNEKPFEFCNEKPTFTKPIPECYKRLIERCWSENPKERPTFEDILIELRTNNEFITENINLDEYYEYIEFIDKYPITFDKYRRINKLEDMINSINPKFNPSEIESKLKNLPKFQFNINLDKFNVTSNRSRYNTNNYDLKPVEDKETNIKYFTRLYKIEINKFLRNEIINFHRMIKIWSQLNHPSILKLIGYSDFNFQNEEKPVLVFEELTNKPNQYYALFATKKLIFIYGVASGMAYLHSHNIIHRDLKLENICLNKDLIPKISGFDIMKQILLSDSKEISLHIKGTPAFLAPEIYLNKEYSKASDVYTFAFLLYELLIEELPFDSKCSPKEIKQKIVYEKYRPPFQRFIPECYKKLIERCWSENPKERPTFEDILIELRTNNEFITENINLDEYYEYIEFIDKYPITFDKDRRINQLEDIINLKLQTFENITFSSNTNIYHTEMNDVNLNYINHHDFKLKENIVGNLYYFISNQKEKKTGNMYGSIMFQITRFASLGKTEFLKQDILNCTNEINIILQLNHPSIIKCIKYTSIDFINSNGPILFIEYLSPLGPLNEIIKNGSELWNMTKKLINIYGIAAGMSYLHANNIIHRDLKTENVLLDNSLYPKISGFRIAISLISNSDLKANEIKGTPAFLAPEIYLNKEYSKASDVYAFAFLLYELLIEELPFDSKCSPKEIKQKIVYEKYRPPFQRFIPEIYKKLIERCWSENPKERPTFEDILIELRTNNEFITENINLNEYYEYIEFIDKYPITFDKDRRINQLDDYYKFKIWLFEDLKSEIFCRNIYETEPNANISYDIDYLDFNNFKKGRLIRKGNVYNVYEVEDKKTNLQYTVKVGYSSSLFDNQLDIIKTSSYLNTIINLKHPSLLNCIGYSPYDFKNEYKPVYLMEKISNNSLNKLFELSEDDRAQIGWNETKKLIAIFGIASAMSCLHLKKVVYCNLKACNVFLDEFLFPKLSLFVLNERDFIFDKDDEYTAPEIMNQNSRNIIYNPESDVYSFAILPYKIIIDHQIYNNISEFKIKELVCEQKKRPEFKDSKHDCFKNLIEKCWSHEPSERPTFDEIVHQLKTNPNFITEKINKEEFLNYVKYIENDQKSQVKLQHNNNCNFQQIKIDFASLINNQSKIKFSVNIKPINLKYFSKISKIGEGGFGVVYKTLNEKTDEICAAKISIFEMDQCSDDIVMNLCREVEIIAQLNHHSLLKFIGFNPNNFKNRPKTVIITEFASGGSLEYILDLERIYCGNHNWNDTKKLINIYGIASGMAYLHKRNIIHRDLKPANILLDEYLFPKIADFGLSKDLSKKSESQLIFQLKSGFKGTYAYSAPEVMEYQHYTKESDVYAFGMIVYEIMTNEVLYKDYNQYQVYRDVINKIRPKFKKEHQVPYCYQKLIENCWSDKDYKRPSFEKIVNLLETNDDFITENIEIEEFIDYVSYLKESENEITFSKVSIDSNLIQKVEEENENESLNNDDGCFLNINEFERQSLIKKGDIYKIYQFKEIKTGNLFAGQMSMIKTKKLTKNDISNLSQLINKISNLNHPSFLKFIGYSPIDFKKQRKPVIVTGIPSNMTLSDILEIERNHNSIIGWDNTKKIINIYGIASGMSYFHSYGIIHRNLKPSNIFLDDFLFPKIGDFGLSDGIISCTESMTNQSISGNKATPVYSSPEILQFNNYTESSDVYAFSFIVYEIITGKVPFDELNGTSQIFNEVVVKRKRPKIDDETVPLFYKNLIEKCWCQDPTERLTFKEIVHYLETNSDFINKNINNNDYQKYIKYINHYLYNQKGSEKIEECENEISTNGICSNEELKI